LIPAGLWLIDGATTQIQLNTFTVPTQTIILPTSAGVATSLVLSGKQYGPATGSTSFLIRPIFLVGGSSQKAQKTPLGSGTSIAQAYPGNVTIGTTLVVFVTGFFSGGCTISSIADTIGNTWTNQGTFTDGATGHIGRVYTCTNKASGANTVTVTFGQSTGGCTLEVAEYSGSIVDQVSSVFYDTASETTVTCPAVTTTKTYELILGIGSTATTGATAGGGYTTELSGASNALGVLVDKNVTAIGSNTPSWTQAANAGNYNLTLSLASTLISQSSWIISGNAGVAGATVSYSGTASGSVTADATGNFVISGLASGNYTLTPSLTGYTFSAPSIQTMSSADIAGVVFTATSVPVVSTYAGDVPMISALLPILKMRMVIARNIKDRKGK
jgi:hypothetical protein